MLPPSLLAALLGAVAAAPAYATPTELMPGVTYDKQLVLSRFGPQVVHVISAPRPGGLYTVGPLLSNAAIPGRETVTAIERRLAPTATIVGVNGDFSTTEGVPAGLVVQGGVLNAQPNVKRSSIGWDATGLMRVERPGLNATWQGSGQRRSFSINRRPSTSGTTLYTPAWGTATPVEPGSTEVVLPGLGGPALAAVRSAPVSEVRIGGATPIPPGGAVLVGRGTSAQRIAEEAKAGTLVT